MNTITKFEEAQHITTDGDGYGNGDGYGDGYSDGDGNGDGYGYGDGNGNGYSYGS